MPLERADHLEVLVAERLDVIFGQGERGQELFSLGAGDQVVIPDDPELAFTSLDADLVTETAGRVAVDFARAQELDEPLLQTAADVVAELGRVLVASLPGAGDPA